MSAHRWSQGGEGIPLCARVGLKNRKPAPIHHFPVAGVMVVVVLAAVVVMVVVSGGFQSLAGTASAVLSAARRSWRMSQLM